MQILVTAVQNAVDPSDIGAATAGANFFRSIGGSFGTAVLGALYTNDLAHRYAIDVKGGFLTKGFPAPARWTPDLLKAQPLNELGVVVREIAGASRPPISGPYRWACWPCCCRSRCLKSNFVRACTQSPMKFLSQTRTP